MLLSKNADIPKEILDKLALHLDANLYNWYRGYKAKEEVFDAFTRDAVEESIRNISDRLSEDSECFVYPCDVSAYYLDLILDSPSDYEREFIETMIKVYGYLNYY